jgi:3-deoxy-7-phosphoheptulonate synthase
MIIQLDREISSKNLSEIISVLSSFSYGATEVNTQCNKYLVAIGKNEIDIRRIGHLSGVKDVHRVTDAYKLVSRKWKVHTSVIDLGDGVKVGDGQLSIILGPCSIENQDQVASVVGFLKSKNIRIMRGGAFKPRTSPYTFRGLGLEGLKMFYEIANKNGIKVISEVVSVTDINDMHDYVDIFQVGARNTQNFALLHELGRVNKPVLIKRGMSGTLEELLQSAEYVFSNGNEKIILCERGIRTFEKAYRNTLDLNSVPVLKEKSHLPVVVDPSHGVGIRRFVEPMALAAIMTGADGLLIEIHEQPEKALSDADQTLNYEEAKELLTKCEKLFELKCEL